MKLFIAEIAINNEADLKKVSTADLLDFYNEATGKNTSKFASRTKGEQQVWKMIKEDVEKMESPKVEKPAAPAKKVEKAEKQEGEGRKVRIKEARKVMKGDRPKDTTADGQVLLALEAAKGKVVRIEELSKTLGRTDRQIRNSISYLRRKYGFQVESLNSQEIKLG